MQRTCDDCLESYDDVYRLTSCPHDVFAMHSVTVAGNVVRCCHTVSEQDAFLKNPQPAPEPCAFNEARLAFFRELGTGKRS